MVCTYFDTFEPWLWIGEEKFANSQKQVTFSIVNRSIKAMNTAVHFISYCLPVRTRFEVLHHFPTFLSTNLKDKLFRRNILLIFIFLLFFFLNERLNFDACNVKILPLVHKKYLQNTTAQQTSYYYRKPIAASRCEQNWMLKAVDQQCYTIPL